MRCNRSWRKKAGMPESNVFRFINKAAIFHRKNIQGHIFSALTAGSAGGAKKHCGLATDMLQGRSLSTAHHRSFKPIPSKISGVHFSIRDSRVFDCLGAEK